MSYLPVYCASCSHASLSSAEKDDGHLRCSFCEAPARVIPGPMYRDADWLTFADIDKGLFEAELDGVHAAELSVLLQHLLDEQAPPLTIVEQMVKRVPSLGSVRPALVAELPRGLRMLLTLLVARTRDVPLTAPSRQDAL